MNDGRWMNPLQENELPKRAVEICTQLEHVASHTLEKKPKNTPTPKHTVERYDCGNVKTVQLGKKLENNNALWIQKIVAAVAVLVNQN